MPRKQMNRGANGAGSIRKITRNQNGKTYTYWQARYTAGFDPGTGKQIQKSISGKTQKEVSQKLKQLTHELDMGTYIAPTKLAVGEWLDIWLKDYLSGVKPSTAHLYKTNVESYIRPLIGALRLEEVTPLQVQRMYNELFQPTRTGRKPLSAKTIRNIHGVFHKSMEQAVRCNMLRLNPANSATIPKVVKKEIVPLDEEIIPHFLDAITGHPHEYLYKIALFTGLRQSEILGITWDCINFDRGTILVKQQLRREQQKGGQYYMCPPKNNRSRVLTLAPSVVQLFRIQKITQQGLQKEVGKLWEGKNMVFTNQTGGYLSYRTVYDCFKRVVDKLGVPDTRFHDLRHTYAVAAIQSGDDIKSVQENLGHSSAAFTLDVYGHFTNQMRRRSASHMETFIQSVSNPLHPQ